MVLLEYQTLNMNLYNLDTPCYEHCLGGSRKEMALSPYTAITGNQMPYWAEHIKKKERKQAEFLLGGSVKRYCWWRILYVYEMTEFFSILTCFVWTKQQKPYEQACNMVSLENLKYSMN